MVHYILLSRIRELCLVTHFSNNKYLQAYMLNELQQILLYLVFFSYYTNPLSDSLSYICSQLSIMFLNIGVSFSFLNASSALLQPTTSRYQLLIVCTAFSLVRIVLAISHMLDNFFVINSGNSYHVIEMLKID